MAGSGTQKPLALWVFVAARCVCRRVARAEYLHGRGGAGRHVAEARLRGEGLRRAASLVRDMCPWRAGRFPGVRVHAEAAGWVLAAAIVNSGNWVVGSDFMWPGLRYTLLEQRVPG